MKLSIILFTLILLSGTSGAFAACSFTGTAHSGSLTVYFNDITVSPLSTVGDVLATGTLSKDEVVSALNTSSLEPFMHCSDGNEMWQWWGTSLGIQPYNGELYLSSGVDGVAIKLRTKNAGIPFTNIVYPAEHTSFPGKEFIFAADIGQVEVELVKVANATGSGISSSGTLMKIGIPEQGLDILEYRINAFSVITGGCEINTKDVTVDLGNAFVQHFSGVGDTRNETTFSIGLTCNNAMSLTPTVTFEGTTDAHNPTVFSNSHGDGYADNIGVQLLKNNNVIHPGEAIPLDKENLISKRDVNFKALLFKLNGSVSPGAVDVPVIFTVSYE